VEQRCSGRLLILHCPDYFYMLRKHAHASSAHLAPIRWPSEAGQTDSKPLLGRRKPPQAPGPYVRRGKGSGVTANTLAMRTNESSYSSYSVTAMARGLQLEATEDHRETVEHGLVCADNLCAAHTAWIAMLRPATRNSLRVTAHWHGLLPMATHAGRSHGSPRPDNLWKGRAHTCCSATLPSVV
jgi:hypothetical protein